MNLLAILLYIVTYIASIVTAICFYEYQRWREQNEVKRRKKGSLKSELNHFINEWDNFKKTEEMHVDPYLREFRDRLSKTADSLQSFASNLKEKKIIAEDLYDEILDVSKNIRGPSVKQIYANGGRSWGDFVNSGDEISKKCNEIKDKLEK
jgi:hypothetical protein